MPEDSTDPKLAIPITLPDAVSVGRDIIPSGALLIKCHVFDIVATIATKEVCMIFLMSSRHGEVR